MIRVIHSLNGSINPLFEFYLVNSYEQGSTTYNPGLCCSLIFGYIHGNINIKSMILEILSILYNPEAVRKENSDVFNLI